MSVAGAVSGSYREALEALRDRLAAEVDGADGRTLAPLSKQLADVLARIDGLPDGGEKSAVDELQAKRAKRRKKASGE